MKQSQFSDLNLIDPLQKALNDLGYSIPTPIQEAAIPILLQGKDLMGCAQTGTGKTAAFALPLLQRLSESKKPRDHRRARALILTPTRELAIQIYDNLLEYGKYLNLKYSVVFGGVGQAPQVKSVLQGVDFLVATPGRLLDLIQQKHIYLDQLEVFVLDEADRMLDMGFINDVRKIIAKLPQSRHNLFFSATMPPEIEKLAGSFLRNPVRVEVAPPASTAELISQSVMYVDKNRKSDLLKHVLKNNDFKRVIVFTRTKHGANKVAESLERSGMSAAAIHGNKSQSARQRALDQFKMGRIRVLVATDIAARGIDVDNISHVINYEIPNVSESYVHRIGRTARAGATGFALSFCDSEEKSFLKDIEKLIRQKIPLITTHPYHSEQVERSPVLSSGKAKAAMEAKSQSHSHSQRRRRPSFRSGPPRASR